MSSVRAQILDKYDKFQDIIACYMFNTTSPYLYERAEVMSKEKNIDIKEAYIAQVKARMIAIKGVDGRKYLKTLGENLYENFQAEYPEKRRDMQTYDSYIDYFIAQLSKIDLDLDLRGKHLLYMTFLRHMITAISEFIIRDPGVVVDCSTKADHLRSAQLIKEQCFQNIYNFKEYINDKFVGKKTRPLDGYIAANRDFIHRNAVLTRRVNQLEEDKVRLLEYIVKQREEMRVIKDELIRAKAIATNNIMNAQQPMMAPVPINATGYSLPRIGMQPGAPIPPPPMPQRGASSNYGRGGSSLVPTEEEEEASDEDGDEEEAEEAESRRGGQTATRASDERTVISNRTATASAFNSTFADDYGNDELI